MAFVELGTQSFLGTSVLKLSLGKTGGTGGIFVCIFSRFSLFRLARLSAINESAFMMSSFDKANDGMLSLERGMLFC